MDSRAVDLPIPLRPTTLNVDAVDRKPLSGPPLTASEYTCRQVEGITGLRPTAATRGFEAGKFNFLDVLDAQRTWFQARIRYLGVVASAYQAATTIDRILGR